MTDWSDRSRPLPRLHLVTDDLVLAGAGFLASAEALLRAGGPGVALHLRGPTTDGRRLFEMAAPLRDAAGASGSLLLVNDRIDVALAARADGVQLGARSLSPRQARPLLGPGARIGVSIRGAGEPVAAGAGVRRLEDSAGADFIVVGTLYESSSHPGRPGTGPGGLTAIAGKGLPVIGIGGITAERVASVLGAGAHGVAVISAIWEAARPLDELSRFLKALEERNGSD